MKAYSNLFLLSCLGITLACQPTADRQTGDGTEASGENTIASSETVADGPQPVVTQKLAPAAFAEKMDALPNEQLIDVRTPAEYQTGHIPQSEIIDFKGKNFRKKMAQLDKARPVMVYCAAGGRSTAAVALLEELEFVEIYELEGGITRWQEAGQVVELE